MRTRNYLDYNATAPVRPEVMDAVLEALGHIGNASSVHAEGRDARGIIERAREKIARLVGAEASHVVFTSGGAEANALALCPAAALSQKTPNGRQPLLFQTPVEHPSALRSGRFAAQYKRVIAVDSNGVVDLERFVEQLGEEGIGAAPSAQNGQPFLVSVIWANNETGAVQPLEDIARIVHERGGILHSDGVQVAGKMPLNITETGVDLLSISAHKFGGPQGVGALIGRAVAPLSGEPLFFSGGQERGVRGGTENLPGIAGFGMAAGVALAELEEMDRIGQFRDGLEVGIRSIAPGAVIFAEKAPRVANTSCFAVPGLRAENLVIAMDLAGIAVSAGAACSSGKVESSHVLEAMGVEKGLASCAIRISLGWATRIEDIERFLSAWTAAYEKSRARAVAAA